MIDKREKGPGLTVEWALCPADGKSREEAEIKRLADLARRDEERRREAEIDSVRKENERNQKKYVMPPQATFYLFIFRTCLFCSSQDVFIHVTLVMNVISRIGKKRVPTLERKMISLV